MGGTPAAGSLPLQRSKFSSVDELPADWWHLAENEAGGYQYRTVVQVLDKKLPGMLLLLAVLWMIGVISLLAAASVLSSCIGGTALQGAPVQDPSVVTCLGSLEKVPFKTCLLQKPGEP